MHSFKNSVVFITGAASGIGRELGRQLATAGARLVLSDIRSEPLEQAVAEIRETGGTAESYLLDVSDGEGFERAIAWVVEHFGQIDYLFNNAGLSTVGEMQDLSLSHWKKVLDVNLLGVVYGSSFGYKQMVKQGHGHIVNTASLAGLSAMPLGLPYTTSKHAVVGLCKTLRQEGKRYNIKVTAVCPGFIESNIYEAAEYVNTGNIGNRSLVKFKLLPTDKAVGIILRGVARNKGTIVFPFYGKLINFIQHNFPWMLNGLYQQSIKDYHRKKHANH
jgi:NAD(P)-dependent dehydrogenase (short-subunit alcohol dehydrogenase family)